MKSIGTWSCEVIVTFFYVGFVPKAPGTWGSLACLPLLKVLWSFADSYGPNWALIVKLIFAACLSLVGWWALIKVEKYWKTHDDKRCVIDEVAGMAICLSVVPMTAFWAFSGFVCFRAFDILKPGPVGWIDRHMTTAWGTMAYDIVAGLLAAAVLVCLRIFIA